jgi:hypothetical protein
MNFSRNKVWALLRCVLVFSFLSLVFICFLSIEASARTITANTNWSALSPVPDATENMVIKNGAIVTVDVSNAVADNISMGVGGGSAGPGTLLFNAGSQLTLSGTNGTLTLGLSASYLGTLDMTLGGTVYVKGFLGNNAALIPGLGLIEVTGSTTLDPNISTYNNLNINVPGGTVTLGATTTINGNLNIIAGTLSANNLDLSVGGNWTNNSATSAFTAGTAAVTFNGTSAQAIGGSSATTFNNLTVSNTGNTVTSGVNSSVAGNLLVSSGTFDLGSFTANRSTAGGTLTVSNGATLKIGGTNTVPTNYSTHSIGATSTVEYSGTNQSLALFSSAQDYGNLTISGSGTKTLAGSVNIGGTLTFTSGTITTGASTLYLKSTAAVTRTSGHVIGNFKKYIATGATSKTFEVGDASNYTPVAVVFGNVTSAGDLTASVVSGDHASIGSSTINATKSVNRNWTLINSLIGFSNYGATFTFVAGDIDGGASTSNFIVGKYSGGWTYPTVGTKTATTTEATGLTSFSDFQIGESASSAKTWDGGAGTNNWGDAANWNADGVPTALDNVDLTGANTININVAAVANNLLLSNGGLALTINSGNSLTLSGNLTLNSGTLNTAASFPSVTGTVNVAGGTVGFTGTGSQTIPAYNYNNLTSSSTGARTLAGSGTIGIAGTFTAGTNTYTVTGSTVNFNGAGAQSIAGTPAFNNLTIANTGNTVTSSVNSSVSGDLSVSSGTFDLATFTANRVSAGGTLTVSNGATLKLGGTNTLPSNYSTHAIGATSTVEYSGTTQSVVVLNSAQDYGNLIISGSATKTLTGSENVNSTLTLSGGALAIGANTLTVSGQISTTSGTLTGGGTSNLIIAGTGASTSLPAVTVNNLTMNRANGITLGGNVTASGVITLTSGIITTTGNALYNSTGTVSRASGHVFGNFKKNVATGATSKTFEVGGATNYTPVTVAFANVTTTGDITASVISGDHASIGSSTINAAKSVNRNWTLTNSGVVFTTYDATFTFVAGDLDGGATTSAFIVGKYSAGWTYPTVGTKTGTTTQATGLTSFSGFQIGEVAAAADTISGTVFEDQNYGGGAGRSLASSSGVVVSGARVELYTGANYTTFATTDAGGNYSFSGLAAGTYTVRVVNGTVNSLRSGTEVLPPVQTYRTNASSGTAVAVTDHVGGEVPGSADAGNGSITLAALTAGAITPQSITTAVLGASNITGADFGYSYSVIVNKNNTGQGSLRQFLLNANALSNSGMAQSGLTSGVDNAVFMLADGTARAGLTASYATQFTAGIASITLASALATISDPTVLDASLQPGYSSAPMIELNGNGAAGLTITAGGTTVRGFIINRMSGAGISLTTNGGNTITGNYIGTNAAGTAASANGNGVNITSANNTIGGATVAARNIISGNNVGVYINGAGATGNVVAGNYIGTNLAGTGAIPNTDFGVHMLSGASGNYIGGAAAGAGNVISGNGNNALQDAAIYIVNAGTTANFVQGNYIGTNATGTAALANNATGLWISGGTTNNTIGGPGAGNTISGNTDYGVYIDGTTTSGNILQGNYIGRNATNTGAIAGQSIFAVTITVDSFNNTIGGTAAGAGNVISGNSASAVNISSGSTGNAIRANSIYGNTGIGVDLASVAAANNGTKSGTLANSGMDSAVFTTASLSGATLTLAGYVGSAASQATFAGATVEVFKSDLDGSGFGEGQTLLGTLTADGSGNLSGTLTVSGLAGGDKITGTATDASNNTSEFGANATVTTGTKTFTGTGNFSDAARWTGSILPVAGESLIIDGACTVDNNAGTDNVAYGTLTIGTATGRTLNWVASGTNRLNVTNVSAGAGASTLSMTNGGTLIIRGTWVSTNLTFTSGAGTIEVQSTITLPAAYTTYTNLTINNPSGTVTSGVGTTLSGSLVVSSTLNLAGFSMTTGDLQGAGIITSSSGTPTLTTGSNNTSTTFSGVIGTGAIALTKNGTGIMTLSGSNTYTGLTTIAGGTLKLGNAAALGSAAATDWTWLNAGGVLDLNGLTTGTEYLRFNGGNLTNSSSTTATYTGQIDIYLNTTTITCDNPIILSGVVAGNPSPGYTKNGASTLKVTFDNNSRAYGVVVNAGTLIIGTNGALGSSTTNPIVVNSGAVLDLNGVNYTYAKTLTLNGTGISGGGALINSSATGATFGNTSSTITLGSASSIVGDTGTIAITGAITGGGFGLTLGGAAGGSVTSIIGGAGTTVTKADAGTWTLSGLNTYTGTTTASAGNLRASNNTIVASTTGAFGNNASGLLLNGGTIQSNVATFSRPLTVTATNSGLDAFGSARTISSTITQSTAGTFNLRAGGTTAASAEGQNLTLSGVISYSTGNLSLTKLGTSNLIFGSQTITLHNLTISAGSLTSTSGTLNLAGNFSNSGTFTHNSGTVNFNGISPQTIGGATFNNLTINNATGAALTADVTYGATLTFTSGILATGAATLIASSTASVSRTSGHVYGNFKKNIATGATNKTFEIGGPTNYTPVSIAFASVTTSGDLTASVLSGDHANIGTSTINASKSVNRDWTLTNSGIVFTNYGATFTFVAGDVDAGASTSAFIVGKYSGGSWTYPTVGTKTATTTQATGLTAFGDFQLGEFTSVKTWDGGAGTNNWGDAANWNADGVPIATDNVDLTGANTITINVAAVANNLLLNNAALMLTINSGNSLAMSGALTLTSGTLNMGTNPINGAGSFTLGAGGNLGIGSTAGITSSGATGNVQVSGTRTFSTAGNYTYNGTAAQVTGNGLPATVNNLTINNSAGVTLSATVAVSSDLTITAGTFDLGSFTANRASAGGTLTIANGATLKIGGTNTLPANFSTHSIGATSTVEYSGTTQSVGVLNSAQDYGHLIISGSGIKTLAGTENVAGNLTVSAGTFDLGANTINRTAAGGTFTVSDGATLKIGGTNSFPTNYTAHSIGSTSTVEYGGITQSVVVLNTAQNYGNLKISGSATKTLAATISVASDLTVSAGTFDLGSFTANRASGGGTLSVAGSSTLKIGGTNTFPSNYSTHSLASFSTVEYAGTNQTVAALNSAQEYSGLTISGSGTKTLTGDLNVAGNLTLTSGTLTTGAYTIYSKATGNVFRVSGWVNGNLKRFINTGSPSRFFDVGNATNYTPVNLVFASVTTAGDLTASTTAGDHANIGTSTIDPLKSVNRNWTLTNSGIVFTNYNATFTFVAGDIDGGASTAAFVVGKYSAGWTYPTVGTKTATTTQATGLIAFGNFQLGEGVPLAPNVTLVNSVAPLGIQSPGTELVFSFTFTNVGGLPANTYVIIDQIPSYTDFKVASATTNLGTTGLTSTVAYSNDSAVTWTYTPVSGGGGAPVNFDSTVTHVRWSFTGNLSQTSPNNTGSISLTARIH